MSISDGREQAIRDALHRDLEQERVDQFSSIISNTEVTIRDVIPDIDQDDYDVRGAMKRFVAYEYKEEPTLYVNPKLGIETGISELRFAPYMSRGGKKSKHGVFFGKLALGGYDGIDVAVKPHDTTLESTDFQYFESAVGDYFKTAAVHDLGVFTLTHAGIFLGSPDDEMAYSMTMLKEGVTTIDSIDWSQFFPNTQRHPGMQQIWTSIAEQLACFHDYSDGKLYKSHGDLAPRNIATSSDEGQFFIDWETASFTPGIPKDTEVGATSAYLDLSVLVESMCLPPHANLGGKNGIGIFYGKQGDWWKGFRDIFWDTYATMRRELANKQSHKNRLTSQLDEELDWLESELEDSIIMYRDICNDIPSLKA